MSTVSKIEAWKEPIKYSLIAFFALRIWNSLVLLINIFLPPTVRPSDPSVLMTLTTLQQQSAISNYLIAPWFRWDSIYYLDISRFGYATPFYSVWPPLYPWLISLFSKAISPDFLAAIMVSNLFTIGCFVVLYLFAEEIKPGIGKSTLYFIVIFPTSFFFMAAYSESVYLFFVLLSLYALHRQRIGVASIFSVLSVLTRLQGVVLALPIFYISIKSFLESGGKDLKKINLLNLFYSTFPIITAIAFSCYTHFGLDYDWPWQILSSQWFQHTGFPWEGILGNIASLLGIKKLVTPISYMAQAYDLVITFMVVYLLFVAIKKLPEIPLIFHLYSWISLFMILVKVDNASLMVSVSRYLLTLFPIFMIQAIMIKQKFVKLIYFAISVGSQALLLICFSWWIWVA